MLLYFVYLGLVVYFSSYAEIRCWIYSGERQVSALRKKYLEAVLKQDVGFFDTDARTGDIVFSVSTDTLLVQDAISEKIGYTFLPCVLAGLSNAPQYMVNKSESLERGCILATDVDSVILPLDACGGDGALAFASLKRNKPLIITVEENETVLNDSADKLGIEAVKVSNYWEAIGVVAAHKAGVNPNSLRRNRIKNIRQTSSVTSNGYAVSTAR